MTDGIRVFIAGLLRKIADRVEPVETPTGEMGYMHAKFGDKAATLSTEFKASASPYEDGIAVVDILTYATSMACVSLAEEGGGVLIGDRVSFKMKLDLEVKVDPEGTEPDESTIPFTINGLHAPLVEVFLDCLPDEDDDDDPSDNPENVVKFRR